MRSRQRLCLLFCLTAALWSCGGDEGSSPDGGPTSADGPAPGEDLVPLDVLPEPLDLVPVDVPPGGEDLLPLDLPQGGDGGADQPWIPIDIPAGEDISTQDLAPGDGPLPPADGPEPDGALEDGAGDGGPDLPVSLEPFVPARQGCSMAHCDPQMTDNAVLSPPMPSRPQDRTPRLLWFDEEAPGAGYGLGCVSNGHSAACSGCGLKEAENLIVYAPDGTRLWTGSFDNQACYSAPLITEDGGVMAVDTQKLVRFNPQGTPLWSATLYGDMPISPVVTENGVVVVALKRNPGSAATSTVYAFDSRTGEPLGHMSEELAAQFDTQNTPCVRGNRVYVSLRDPQAGESRLQALDIDPEAPEPVALGPAFEGFRPPQGASPLCVGDRIYFDGTLNDRTHAIAVRDLGDRLEFLWSFEMQGRVEASLAHDPRGGIWGWAVGFVSLFRWDEETGAVLDQINVDELVGIALDIQIPSSPMTIAGGPADPVMMFFAKPLVSGASFLVAVDLLTNRMAWSYEFLEMGLFSAPQFPIVEGPQGKVLIVPTYSFGARGIGF